LPWAIGRALTSPLTLTTSPSATWAQPGRPTPSAWAPARAVPSLPVSAGWRWGEQPGDD
jgi:hypothetical protein